MACIRKTTVCVVFVVLCAVLSQIEARACETQDDCPFQQYCCYRNSGEYSDHVCRDNCIGEPCGQGYHQCAPGEVCCGNDEQFAGICARSCSGESCWWFRGCVNPKEKCCSLNNGTDFKCKPDCNASDGSADWIIAIIVLIVLVGFIVLIAVVLYRRCATSRRYTQIGMSQRHIITIVDQENQ